MIRKNKGTYQWIVFGLILVVTALGMQLDLQAEQMENPESIVDVEFREGDAQVGPVDPDDPETPGNGGSEGSGALAINFITPIFFGTQDISPYEEEYPSLTIRPFLQVTDLRGTGAGWEVSAEASTFKNKGKDSLLGSTITLMDASCISPGKNVDPPVPEDPVVLKTDGETTVPIVKAGKDEGMGLWLTRWYTDSKAEENYSVILTVPGGTAMAGDNVARITWTLLDVPLT